MKLYKSRNDFLSEKIKDKSVLSLGCADMDGKGKQFLQLEKLASKMYGLDYNKSFCDLHDNIYYADFNEDFSLIKKTHSKSLFLFDVDVIVMTEVLEHLNNPFATLSIIKKNWGGKKLLFSVPNACSLGKVIRVLSNDKLVPNDDDDHLYMFNFRNIRNILERNNIKNYQINVFDERVLFYPIVKIFKHFAQSFCVELTL